MFGLCVIGSPDWTWTSDTLINSQVLLPTELRRNIETQQVLSLLCLLSVGAYLSSRTVAHRVLSTQVSLTTVFGMGTGGPSPLSAPTNERGLSKLNNERKEWQDINHWGLSPRPISIRWLNTLPCLHLEPINLVVYKGSYCLRMGYLILRTASRLDAFSVYPIRT